MIAEKIKLSQRLASMLDVAVSEGTITESEAAGMLIGMAVGRTPREQWPKLREAYAEIENACAAYSDAVGN